MRAALLTREYPPDVYGGAGVHVEYLARELSQLEEVTVHAWGAGDVPHYAWDALAGDEASQIALVTAVALARRVYLGGVVVECRATEPLSARLPLGSTLGDAIIALGAQRIGAEPVPIPSVSTLEQRILPTIDRVLDLFRLEQPGVP